MKMNRNMRMLNLLVVLVLAGCGGGPENCPTNQGEGYVPGAPCIDYGPPPEVVLSAPVNARVGLPTVLSADITVSRGGVESAVFCVWETENIGPYSNDSLRLCHVDPMFPTAAGVFRAFSSSAPYTTVWTPTKAGNFTLWVYASTDLHSAGAATVSFDVAP